jgi:hypothetical protein
MLKKGGKNELNFSRFLAEECARALFGFSLRERGARPTLASGSFYGKMNSAVIS